MTKRVLSLILAVLMIFSIMPVYATDSAEVPSGASGTASGVDGSYSAGVASGTASAGSAAAGGGNSSSTSGPYMTGKINVPEGYVFSGEEWLEIYISESYESAGYKYYVSPIVERDGTYVAYLPSDLTGTYAVTLATDGFGAPAVDGWFNCHNDAMITFTGGNVSGVDFTIEKCKTVSGQISLGEDAILENGSLYGWICAYEYDGEFIDMKELGEGQFSTFFDSETGSFEYELTLRESVENIVLAVIAKSEQMSEGAFKSNILDDYVYYAGESSSADYTQAQVITVDGDTSDIDIQLHTGVGFAYYGKLPVDIYQQVTDLYIIDKADNSVIYSGGMYLDTDGTNGSVVFPKEYLNKEVYVYYDLRYSNDTLHTEPLYINPDGSLAKTKEEAISHILTGANYVSFTAGLKSEFTTGISGKITFEEGCTLNGYFYCTITAKNTVTNEYEYAHINNTGIGEYSYTIPISQDGTYIVWADIDTYDDSSNVSKCDYYYTSDGMVYNETNAEVIDTTVKNKGIDFEIKKTKTFKGKITTDEEIIYSEQFRPEINIQSDNGSCWQYITLNDDLTFDIKVPVNVSGNCTAYIRTNTGSNIVPGYYYYSDGEDDKFDIEAGDTIEFKLETGNLIKGKVKIPESVDSSYRKSINVSLATESSSGYLETKQNGYVTFESGEREAEFMFAVSKTENTEYILYGQLSGYIENLYNKKFYYAGNEKSSINKEKAVKVTGGTENIELYAINGTQSTVTVTNPEDAEYVNGSYSIDFGDFVEEGYFYLSSGEKYTNSIILTDEHKGLEAYVSYSARLYNNIRIYVNPDGTLTNDKSKAKKHTITENSSFDITVSNDQSLYTVGAIKGTISLSDDAYLTYSDGTDATLEGNVYLYKNGYQTYSNYIELKKGEKTEFEFNPSEIADYTLGFYANNWSYDTNVVCGKVMYYTGDGWSEKKEDAKTINNSSEQSLELYAPELDVLKGTVKFGEGAFLNEEMRYQITYTAVDGSTSKTKRGYIRTGEDFEYKITKLDGIEECYVSINFGSSYSDYDTNIPYGKTYYYTENGLTTDETAVRKVVKATDNITLNVPVMPTITGTVKFPEDTELSGQGYVYIRLDDQDGRQISTKYCYTDKAEDIKFAIAGNETAEKYVLSAHFNSQGYETSLEQGALYYTKEGMTSNPDNKKYYTIEELEGAELTLRNRRYVTGKLVADNLINYEETLSAWAEFSTGTRWMYNPVVFDEDLNYKVEIPAEIDGNFTIGFRFDSEYKNNIIKDIYYYYSDQYGEEKYITYPNCDNINIVAETGYIFSGVVKLPENAIVYENCAISGTVEYADEYEAEFSISYGEKEGNFFMVLPKRKHQGYLRLWVNNSSENNAENLYETAWYKSDDSSVVKSEDAKKYTVTGDTADAQIMLITGAVYKINVKKPESITNSERVNIYAKIGDDTILKTITIGRDETSKTVTVAVPEYYYGKEMYLYYLLPDNNSNTLYREEVYISKDSSLKGAEKNADTFVVDADGADIQIELADYTEDDVVFPEYVYKSPYPYKDYADNSFSYEYTEGDCDYLKVTFAPETYLGYYDYAYIYDKDGQQVGRYSSGSLAGTSISIPGNSFTVSIEGNYYYTAFGIAIESIEPKKYTLESEHPYISSSNKEYPYTHKTEAEGLRLHFSEDTDFNGYMTIEYTHNGQNEELYIKDYNLAGRTVDVRGNSFNITMPKDTSGNYYGFTIVEIEEIEYCDVVFQNYDGTILGKKEVEKGYSTYYSGNTPVRERDEEYIYIFEDWDKSLENVTEDMVVTAEFSENPYATVQFKNSAEDTEPLYTDYVILGESANFEGDTYPSKVSTETKGYIFAGWSRSLKNIKEDTVITAEFEEYDIIIKNTSANEEQTYTYEGSADSIVLVFSSDSKIGENDYLHFYDEKGNEVFSINGETLTDGEYVIVGKTVTLRLVGENSYYALLEVAPMWHDFNDWYQYIDPDCTTEGMEYRWCYNCYTEEEREVPALGHSFGAWEEDLDGTIFRECVRCAEREIFDGDLSHCGMVNINVVDAVTMKPLENVMLTAYDEAENETVWYTNEEGVASQMLNEGVNNLVVYLDGYLMRNISLDIKGGITNVPVIGLTEKPAVQCKLEAKIMDMEAIKAAGIDTSDPLNSHVYKYSINLGFGEKQDVYFNKEGTYIDRGGIVVRDSTTDTTATIHPVNENYYLVIYGQAKWLKEMFDVELVAVNTSNTDTVENLVAELKLPDGMSLAAMNRAPQSDVQRMGSLASGESKAVHWYVRGDKEGEYKLSAKLTGTFMPFNEQFGYEYTTDEPVKVYAGSALQMNLIVPAVVTYGEDCIVKIEIENVSDRSVYNLSNSIDKVLQSKFLAVDKDGYEKYYEENALGYVAVDELKPGEKIVAEIKSNILFKSDVIKDKIGSLANRLQNETDILAIFNSYKSTLDLLNDNYDIIYNALGNVTRAKEHKGGLESLEGVLTNCEILVKDGVSSRAMYFINRIKQENTLEELTKLSKDANFYTVWTDEKINKLSAEIKALYDEAIDPEKCSDFDIYEDVKRVIEAVPVSFWLKDVFVAKLEGSTTDIPYMVTVIPAEESYTGVTNISNYYYNILTDAIDMLSQPWYTEIMGKIRDPEGVAQANKIIKTDIGKTLTFAVTDVTGDTRFNAWVEGENGAKFELSSTAENEGVTEGGITFTGPSYLMVSSDVMGKGTLYVEKISDVATFTTNNDVFSFEIETIEEHICSNDVWTEVVTAYDDNDGYEAKYCSTCGVLMDMRTIEAKDESSSGSYVISEESISENTFKCKMSFDDETPARSAKAIIVMKNKNGVVVQTGTDDIKIKPNSTVDIEISVKNVEYEEYKILLWDSFMKLRPVANN